MVRNHHLRDRLLFFILLFVWSYLRFLLGLFSRLGFGGNIVSFMSGKRRISPKNIHAKSKNKPYIIPNTKKSENNSNYHSPALSTQQNTYHNLTHSNFNNN